MLLNKAPIFLNCTGLIIRNKDEMHIIQLLLKRWILFKMNPVYTSMTMALVFFELKWWFLIRMKCILLGCCWEGAFYLKWNQSTIMPLVFFDWTGLMSPNNSEVHIILLLLRRCAFFSKIDPASTFAILSNLPTFLSRLFTRKQPIQRGKTASVLFSNA